ncbi:MAG: NADH-quinone oxidoreductase subunit L [Nitriliruptorales bacterium]|nr:NADH-quinone oxidoreductase subunit L [Nitriliruptorales bacterium]
MIVLAAEAAGRPLEAISSPSAGSPVDLAWLIPVVPAISAALLLLFGKRLGRASAWVAVAAVGVSTWLSTTVFVFLAGQPAGERTFIRSLGTWLNAGEMDVEWSILVDPLSSVMLLLVTWVSLFIHLYSVGYMHGDERYSRFFGYLNLFVASMLVLVLGESFVTLFVGWELVGLCSYLLIGFWFERRAYASAATKAFILNRIGDAGFIIAMLVIFAQFGSLSLGAVLPEAATVLTTGTAAVICLLLLIAATGKSAQIPLYVWLPDAMAGPTPVSALIHAATMVTAGVYLIARTSPLYALADDVGLLVATVGIATALITAIIACAQVDLKKILAYSTISQLGYMFVGVGIGDYTAGIFHLLTHGFFKALLFLAAGSVMHALADEADIRRMGGLFRTMPVTATTSAIGVLAIAGLPPLAGFWSKEEILAAAAGSSEAGVVIWALGILVAGLTAFYMTRWFVLIFLGRERWRTVDQPTAPADQEAGVRGGPPRPTLHPHESPPSMTVPLIVLAAASALGGLINIDPETGFLHGWLVGPSVLAFEPQIDVLTGTVQVAAAVLVSVLGIGVAWTMYRRVDIATVGVGGGVRRAAREAFRVDGLYETIVLRPGRLLAEGFSLFDRRGVDGAVNGLARLTGGLATLGRRTQTGFVRSYALAVLGGAVLITMLFIGIIVRTGAN